MLKFSVISLKFVHAAPYCSYTDHIHKFLEGEGRLNSQARIDTKIPRDNKERENLFHSKKMGWS